jgi:protein TonB
LALSYRPAPAYGATPLRRRASGLGLALGVNLLVIMALLTLGVRLPLPKGSDVTIVDMFPPSRDAVEPASAAPTKPKSKTAPSPQKPILPPPIVPPAVKSEATRPLDMIIVTPQEYAASDIGKMPKAEAAGPSPGDSEEVGRGPNGEVLYAAEWARHPTHTELSNYLPRNAPEGYGLIACKTAPGNRVEDCIELDQSPRGSHLASAVRQAAWQFRVKPPRKNGQAMIGEWVRIRIDYVIGG